MAKRQKTKTYVLAKPAASLQISMELDALQSQPGRLSRGGVVPLRAEGLSSGSAWRRGSQGHGRHQAWHTHLKSRDQGTRRHETKQGVAWQRDTERNASASSLERM